VYRFVRLAILTASLFALWAPTAPAASLDSIGSFDRPIFVTSDPDDPDRLFVVERDGIVVEVDGESTATFANLTQWVSCCSGERGMASIAPAPDFAGSERFYAAYAGKPAAGGQEGDFHVDSFRPDPEEEGELIREPILSIGHAQFNTHYAGQLQFGPDGYLYISTGDGGGAGDPLGSGQDLETLLGKLLRIEPRPGEEPSYAIPSGNPFVGEPGLDEIWSYGLRNPWRFSFDRLSGDLVIADVGQRLHEEVDHAKSPGADVVGGAGTNYGWNCREGLVPYELAPAECEELDGFTDPVFDYPHTDPGGGAAHGCSITGGYVVRDPALGEIAGRYVYADFCQGEIRSLVLPSAGGVATGDRSECLEVANPTSFGEGSDGRLYVASNGGAVYRIESGAAPGCPQEPPGEGEPSPAPASGGGALVSAPDQARGTLRVHLRGSRRGDRVQVAVWVTPCASARGDRVRLNRGGQPLASKRLDKDCTASFHFTLSKAATFRALFETDAGGTARSRRLALKASPG
jgi:hypothetical protein